MQFSKLVLIAIVSIGGLLRGGDAAAGIPVIDVANLAQAIQQVLAWAQQYEQMAQQYRQQVRHYEAISGSRNLGDILYNPLLRRTVDPDFVRTMQSIYEIGEGGLNARARAIRNLDSIYNCGDRTGTDRRRCEAALSINSQAMANDESALELLNQRMEQIQALQARINGTRDLKAIGELQARISSEQAQVANDANRLVVMQAYQAAQMQAIQQQLKEEELRNLSLTSDGTDTFVFRP